MEGKIIILSAPSGCGKSTIIKALMERGDLNLRFSVSATNRPPRVGEINGIHYHFLSDEEFRSHIKSGDFVEHEEVYPGRFYGTLRSEIDSILASGFNCILDIDVEGALNVKKIYGDRAIAIFIAPPSLEELANRLRLRATDSESDISKRLSKAETEMGYEPRFDNTVVNDDLASAWWRVTHDVGEYCREHAPMQN